MKKFKNKTTYIIIGIFLFLLTISITFGRYIYYGLRDRYLASKSFYFNSDKLTQNRRVYKLDNYSGVDTYHLSLTLNNSDNNLNHANEDIEYTLSYVCSSNAICSISKESGTIYVDEISDT